MTQIELDKLLASGDTRLYAKMPKVWADMKIHETLRKEGLAWAIRDEEGKVVRPKLYREYLLILAENKDYVLAKLLEQDANTCFTKTLKKPERDIIVKMLKIENIMSHDEALKERGCMEEEPVELTQEEIDELAKGNDCTPSVTNCKYCTESCDSPWQTDNIAINPDPGVTE